MTRAARTTRPRARRGLTFLEVIAAILLLTLVAITVLGGVSFLETASARDRYRLAATEVAHRVILQYMDNPSALPDPKLPYEFDEPVPGSHYRWVLRKEVLVNDPDAERGSSRRRSKVTSAASIDEKVKSLHQVTVEVYLFNDDNQMVSAAEPLATLTRVYNFMNDRVDPDRNKDRLLDIVEQATGTKLTLPENEQRGDRRRAPGGRIDRNKRND